MSRFIKYGVFGAALVLMVGEVVRAQQVQPGAAGNAQAPATATSAVGNGAIMPNPWHAGMQQQLNLTPPQTQQLNAAYAEQFKRYQQQVTALPNNLSPADRQQRLISYDGGALRWSGLSASLFDATISPARS